MPVTKRKITVLFTDKCDKCKRVVKPWEEAYLDQNMKLTCKGCEDDIRTKS